MPIADAFKPRPGDLDFQLPEGWLYGLGPGVIAPQEMIDRERPTEQEAGEGRSAGLAERIRAWHDKYIKPWGSAYPRQEPEWVKDHPGLADFLRRGLPLALMGLRSAAGATIGADALGPNRYNWLGKIDRPPLKFDEYGYLEGNYRAPKPWTPEFVGPPDPALRATPQSVPSPKMSPLEEMLARAEATSRDRNNRQ